MFKTQQLLIKIVHLKIIMKETPTRIIDFTFY